MREVNFSIPNVNKASVGITTALYDRRALDCTSTLPLINSLNHLAYLTTSSARIRDILTVDGGVERLVCLLKAGRSKDPMDMWKWNLAFQCVVNVGVRGSENVRTRVVEADLIPVIATILDNYIKVIDRYREKAEEAMHAHELRLHASRSIENQDSHKDTSFPNRTIRPLAESRGSRRQTSPPSIEIPASFSNSLYNTGHDPMDIAPTGHQVTLSLPSERTSYPPIRRHHHHRSQDARQHFLPPSRHNIQPLATAVPSMDGPDGFSIRPVRDVDRLPSMVVGFHHSNTSQPQSPTTPLPPNSMHPSTMRSNSMMASAVRTRGRPNIRHDTSPGGHEYPNTTDSMISDESAEPEISAVSPATIQSPVNVNIQDIGIDEADSMITNVESRLVLTNPNASEPQDTGNFNMNHRSAFNGGLLENTPLQPSPTLGVLPTGQPIVNALPIVSHTNHVSRFPYDRPTNCQVLAAMPRDEDVLMSLQLLAYVSKYCNLRPYFQKSHLVPKLKIGKELNLLYTDEATGSFPSFTCARPGGSPINIPRSEIKKEEEEEGEAVEQGDAEEEEYLLPNDFNIFPLVEKFTIRHHSQDMQYWAGVVMRNLCRKDDSRGGIRQCAHYQCGKWEQYTRQFAKCRRCRRTKYCSKECQKSAWIFHRHWCVAANS